VTRRGLDPPGENAVVDPPRHPILTLPSFRPQRRRPRSPVLACPTCRGRMKLVAMVTKRESITRYLAAIGELT
jgi:hypothetical protein